MKSILLALFILILGQTAVAAEHKHHGAHVHGSANLNIAFDDLKGKLNFKSASMGIVGFEHRAVSKKDIKKLDDSVAKFENEIGAMIQFESALGCKFTKEKIAMVSDDDGDKKNAAEHSDFVAEFSIGCQKPITGSKVVFDFSNFKSLTDIDVVFLIGDLQKTVEINKKPVTLEIK